MIDTSSLALSRIARSLPGKHHYKELERQSLRWIFNRLRFSLEAKVERYAPVKMLEIADLLLTSKKSEKEPQDQEQKREDIQEFLDLFKEQAQKFNWYKSAKREEAVNYWSKKDSSGETDYPWQKQFEIGCFILPSEMRSKYLPRHTLIGGGKARQVLKQVLDLSDDQPLDWDTTSLGQKNQADELKSRGYDTTQSSDLTDYFNTRDLTINEVAIWGDQLLVSDICLADTLTGTVRPSQYTREHRFRDSNGQPYYPFRNLLRSVRFAVKNGYSLANIEKSDWERFELPAVEKGQIKVEVESDYYYDDEKDYDRETTTREFRHEVFNLALQLDRAAQSGVAELYHQYLRQLNLTNTEDASELQEELEALLKELDSDFTFRFRIPKSTSALERLNYQSQMPETSHLAEELENLYQTKYGQKDERFRKHY